MNPEFFNAWGDFTYPPAQRRSFVCGVHINSLDKTRDPIFETRDPGLRTRLMTTWARRLGTRRWPRSVALPVRVSLVVLVVLGMIVYAGARQHGSGVMSEDSLSLDSLSPTAEKVSAPWPALSSTSTSRPPKELRRGLPSVYRQGDGRNNRDDQEQSGLDSTKENESDTETNDTMTLLNDRNSTCPSISLAETTLMLRLDRLPGQWYYGVRIKTSCEGSNGESYPPVYTSLSGGDVVLYGNRRYVRVMPNEVVGSLSCGETIRCAHSLAYSTFGGIAEIQVASGESCDYDYRNFIQWGYRERGLGYTCSEPGLMYTLMCVECQFDDFDWDLAYNMSGDPLERGSSGSGSFNYVLVITAVSLVGFAIVVAFVVMIVRSRRRAGIDREVAEMVSRRERERREREREGSEKPPELFEVGDVELAEVGKGYTGPVVVRYDTLVEEDPEAGIDADAMAGSVAGGEQGAGVAMDKELSGESSVPLSRATSRATTNWTLTQIAVLDPDIGDEEVEESSERGDGLGGVVVEEVKDDEDDEHFSDADEDPPASTSSRTTT